MSAWLGLIWALRALAAGAEPPAASFAGTVVVVAERAPVPLAAVPAAVSRLERAEIERLPAGTLAELLGHLPGFEVLQPDGLSGVPMVGARGFFGGGEAEYVQLRVDGVPVADPESGLADWRAVRAAGIERVEAVRGPAAALYGDAALGGVIEVVTRPPGPAPRLELAGSAGGFGTVSLDLGEIPRSGGRLPAASAGGFRTDGWRRHASQEELALGLALAVSGWRLDVQGTGREREEPGPLDPLALAHDRRGSDPRFDGDRERSRRARAAVGWSGAGGATLALFFADRSTEAVRTLLLAPELADSQRRRIDSEVAGLAAGTQRAATLLGRTLDLRGGVDLGREWMRTGYRAVDGETLAAARASDRRDRAAAFLHGGWQATPRLLLAAGTRWDGIRDAPGDGRGRTLEAWSPRLGATLDLGRRGSAEGGTTTAFVQAARAFRAPTPDQLFDPRPFPDGTGGGFRISNPELGPQRARTLEMGLRRESRRHAGELALYRTDVEDEIDFDVATFRYRNIGSTRHRGVELAWRSAPAAPARAALSYAFTAVEPVRGEQRGRQLKNVARHRGRIAAGVSRGSWDLDLAASWVGRRFLDDAETSPVASAWRVDLRTARALGRLRLHLDALNLLDRDDVAVGYVLTGFDGVATPLVFPAAGRSWRLGFGLAF